MSGFVLTSQNTSGDPSHQCKRDVEWMQTRIQAMYTISGFERPAGTKIDSRVCSCSARTSGNRHYFCYIIGPFTTMCNVIDKRRMNPYSSHGWILECGHIMLLDFSFDIRMLVFCRFCHRPLTLFSICSAEKGRDLVRISFLSMIPASKCQL